MFGALFKMRKAAAAPPAPEPPPKDPLLLTCNDLVFHVGFTTRRAIERRIGPAIEYPAPGWRTWAAAGRRGDVWILSAIYRGQVLIGIEHYLSKTDNLPRFTPPVNGVFTLQPGDVGLGAPVAKLPERFIAQPGKAGSVRALVYQHAFQARWPHGIAIVSGNDGRVERIALYADHEMPTLPEAPSEDESGPSTSSG